MKDCKAAMYNPANVCTDRCKWPGACVNGRLSVASVMETTAAYIANDVEDAPVAETAQVVELPKKKAGRPKKST